MRTFIRISAVLIVLLALCVSLLPRQVGASSHREAPLISADPLADNTDLYAFVSPDRPDTVTIVANYIPLQEPAGGPNFTAFGEDVLYSINIDNDGSGREDIQYQFRFTTRVRNPNTFLYNTGPINALDDPDWNMPQFYSVTRVDKSGSSVRTRRIADNLPTPPVNVGPRSTPNYEALASAAAQTIGDGIKVFAGQRDDPFFVDLGSIFDLGGLRPFNNAQVIPLDPASGVDGVAGYNVHTIALQIPITQITRKGNRPAADDPEAVLGIYASAYRQSTRVLRADGTVRNSGAFVQVSRLGEPLINEVIIPVGQKDRWNASDPGSDSQFAKFYQQPELATLVNVLYPSLPDARTSGRDDLVAILLTGVPGLNLSKDRMGKVRQADLLRLNTAIPPCTADPVDDTGTCQRTGVLAGDLAGFPNGRRLEDDVTDIELRAVADGYGAFLNTNFGLPNLSPNNQVGDGVNANDQPFLSSFPYVATPRQGYEHTHHNQTMTSANRPQ